MTVKKALLLFTLIITGSSAAIIPCELSHAMNIDKDSLYETVNTLSRLKPARNYRNLQSLDKAADYIKEKLDDYGYTPQEQKYKVEENEYKNIIVTAGPEDAPTLVVGAHYDVCGDQPGADDNASGIAGLLEIARLLQEYRPSLKYRIELVAYTLEEPPFFRSRLMGSYVHAKSLRDSKRQVMGMMGLEMIGYYTDEKNTQDYPTSLLKLFYPKEGNFIALVGRYADGQLINALKNQMKKTAIKVRSLKAPAFMTGVDFSDHLNYWNFGYSAVMVTDTAFYRNPNYHQSSDTIETLDFDKMSEVVKGLYLAIVNLERK